MDPSRSAQRIVFLDVDGTIVDHAQAIAPSVRAAVSGARAAGHLVFVCTGRSRAEIPPRVLDLGFDGVVSAGGGFVEHGDALLLARTMPPDAARRAVAFFHEHGIEYVLQAYDTVWPSEQMLERAAPAFTRIGVDLLPADGVAQGDAARLARSFTYRGPAPFDGIAKAAFFGDTPDTFATVRDGLGEAYHVITGAIPYLGTSGGEVSMRGMTKGSAIVELLDRLGMSLDQAIAVGDGANDVEMLQVVGVGVAMGNAPDVVKAHADEVTTSVDDDGVWNVLHRHGLV